MEPRLRALADAAQKENLERSMGRLLRRHAAGFNMTLTSHTCKVVDGKLHVSAIFKGRPHRTVLGLQYCSQEEAERQCQNETKLLKSKLLQTWNMLVSIWKPSDTAREATLEITHDS